MRKQGNILFLSIPEIKKNTLGGLEHMVTDRIYVEESPGLLLRKHTAQKQL